MTRFAPLAVITLTVLALQGSNAQCTQKNGRYPVEGQCDAYIQCINGVPEEKLCPDGLLFKEDTRECSYAPSILCTRGRQQPPNGTDECPRQFGFYRLGEDPSRCGAYINCAHGVGKLTKCPEGLAFNRDTYRCDWPDETPDCDAEAFLGYTCPPKEQTIPVYGEEDKEDLKYYPHQSDCKYYYVCVNGRPRLYKCAKFLVFNPSTKLCDFFDNVPGCKVEHTPEYKEFQAAERLRQMNEEFLKEVAETEST